MQGFVGVAVTRCNAKCRLNAIVVQTEKERTVLILGVIPVPVLKV